jgi:hypothetical protein
VSRGRRFIIGVTLAVLAVVAVVNVLLVGSSRNDVRTAMRVPPVAEGELVRRLTSRPSVPPGDAQLKRSALRVLASERRSGGIGRALGAAHAKVVQVGELNAGGRRLGATMLVDVDPVRRNVRATVPAYIPATGDSDSPYTAQRVQMHVALLRDALIDVDLGRRRVIAFEPGPRSNALSWSPSRAPAPAGAGDED